MRDWIICLGFALVVAATVNIGFRSFVDSFRHYNVATETLMILLSPLIVIVLIIVFIAMEGWGLLKKLIGCFKKQPCSHEYAPSYRAVSRCMHCKLVEGKSYEQ